MFLDEKKSGEAATQTRSLQVHQRLLLRAAEIIEQRGLRQGGFGGDSPDDSVCTLRAIDIAVKEFGLDKNAYNGWGAPRSAIMAYTGCDSVIIWTDNEARTQDEVIGVLRGAAMLP